MTKIRDNAGNRIKFAIPDKFTTASYEMRPCEKQESKLVDTSRKI